MAYPKKNSLILISHNDYWSLYSIPSIFYIAIFDGRLLKFEQSLNYEQTNHQRMINDPFQRFIGHFEFAILLWDVCFAFTPIYRKRSCPEYQKQENQSFKLCQLIIMKNQSTPFERMGVTQESDLQDIFKILAELDKSKPPPDTLHELSNKSQPSKRREYDPPISQESELYPASISHKFSPKIKKTHTSAKLSDRLIAQPFKSEIQFSLNQQSNISAQSVEEAESQVQIKSTKVTQNMAFLSKDNSQKLAEKGKVVDELQRQLQQFEFKYNQREKTALQEKNKQKSILSSVLRDSKSQTIKYYQYLQHIYAERKKIIKEEIIQKNTLLLKVLKEEQSKYKPKKKIKNSQTMSLSDEEEQKLSQFMQKQKKYYFSVIGAKIEKEKEKFEGLSLSLNQKKIVTLSQQRLKSLKKLQQLKQIQPLYIIESSNPSVQQILAVDLEKCHQVRIQSIKFNPTISTEQRVKIFESIEKQVCSGKKIIANSLIFNQKSSIFIPLSNLCMREDEILLVNECSHSYFSLESFLNRIQLGPIEQQFHIVRYIIRICLKGMQEVNTQLKHEKFVILPFNLYFNQKWELKLSNIVLNQLLFHNFRHIFHEDDHFYFPPEQKPDKHSFSLWSLGILTFFLCFGGKPFQKYQPYHWNSREEFFMFNELQATQKPAAFDKCKDFIMFCLTKKGSINFNEVCCETFLSQVK